MSAIFMGMVGACVCCLIRADALLAGAGREWQAPAEPHAELLLSRRMRMCRAAPVSGLQTASTALLQPGWAHQPSQHTGWLLLCTLSLSHPSISSAGSASSSLPPDFHTPGWVDGAVPGVPYEQLASICQPPGCRS